MTKKTAVSEETLVKLFPKIFFLSVIIVATIGLSYYAYITKFSSTTSEDESKRIIEKVSKIIILPNEVPTVAKIGDITKLKNQQFFINAQNGDQVLFFNTAKKAILYRESINKIIEVSPITITTPAPTEMITPTLSPTQKIKIIPTK
jgi:hypothetical protein